MSRPRENPPIAFKRHAARLNRPVRAPSDVPAFSELQCISNFSFLRGASHPGEMVIRAKELGHHAVGIADHNTLAGVVRAHAEAKRENMRLIVGARINLTDGFSCLCYPTDRAAYGRLCKMLSDGKRSAPKGECHIALSDLLGHVKGQVIILLPPDDFARQHHAFADMATQLKGASPSGLWVALHWLFRGNDRQRMREIAALAAELDIALVAANAPLYHDPQRRRLQDVVTCIREGCSIKRAGFLLQANAERHLKTPQEMARLFRDYPEAIAATDDIVALCKFNLDELQYNYPNEPVPPGKTAQGHLTDLVEKGLSERFGEAVPSKVRALVDKELRLIDELGYAHYFLTVHDIVAWARKHEILCQGRGSAANSAVCYYLNVTSVNPANSALLFERFLSKERKEPPDIDVDFEHERREEVIQYVYRRYGRHRAAIAATVITYRPRSAVREVGKVMGLSEDVTSALASTVWGSWRKEIPEEHIKEAGLDLSDPLLKTTVELTQQLLGFPRHLSQHVGGFVLTEDPLEELVPIGNAAMDDRTFIEWDKDDIDELKIMKVDVLALGMLTCIAKCFAEIKTHYGQELTLHNIEQDDPNVYAMLQRADAIGVFQVESRAQLNMLPRLRPEKFYDLVIEVAIVRPGPIQGDMVHPYLRRRDGIESVDYPYPKNYPDRKNELRDILGRTLGVPLFQEQAMQIAIDAAKFTPEEANQLRRAMATFRNVGTIHEHQQRMVSKMIERGYDPQFAANCFEQIKGFGSYGFPESHAASFAQLVYISSWLKHYFPDVFCTALLNSQPMGFYAPAQIVRDAREHDVEVRAVDINHSYWDNTLEECLEDGGFAVRLGFRQVSGLKEDELRSFTLKRDAKGPLRKFASPDQARQMTGLGIATLECLAAADCFRSMDLDRRQALWSIRSLGSDTQLPLFDQANVSSLGTDPEVRLPQMPLREHVVADYQTHKLSLKSHPMALLRPIYDRGIASQRPGRKHRKPRRPLKAVELFKTAHKSWVSVAGAVLVRQRPGTAKGVVFITIEDETGTANIVVWSKVMARHRRIVMNARLLAVHGQMEREGDVIHIIADELIDLTADLDMLSEDTFEQMLNGGKPEYAPSSQPPTKPQNGKMVPLSHADEVTNQQAGRDLAEQEAWRQQSAPARPVVVNQGRHPRNVRIIPKSRDFH